jgi:hypothetical protein
MNLDCLSDSPSVFTRCKPAGISLLHVNISVVASLPVIKNANQLLSHRYNYYSTWPSSHIGSQHPSQRLLQVSDIRQSRNSSIAMHTLALLPFVSTFLVLNSQALILPSANETNVHWRQITSQATATPPSPKWTNETTFALLSVCATLCCFTIGLAWPRLRRCCTSQRKGMHNVPTSLCTCYALH